MATGKAKGDDGIGRLMDVPVEGGVTEDYLKGYVEAWWTGLDQFVKYLNGGQI